MDKLKQEITEITMYCQKRIVLEFYLNHFNIQLSDC